MSKFQRKHSFASGTTISWLEPKVSVPNHFKNGADQNFSAEENKPSSVKEDLSISDSCQLIGVREHEGLSCVVWLLLYFRKAEGRLFFETFLKKFLDMSWGLTRGSSTVLFSGFWQIFAPINVEQETWKSKY